MQQGLTTDTGVRAGLGAVVVVAEVQSSSCEGMRPLARQPDVGACGLLEPQISHLGITQGSVKVRGNT